MPIYDYRCQNDHRFEVIQKFSDDPLTVCEVCGAPASRVLHPVAIHFKGSGFYSTDYGSKKKSAADRSDNGDSKPAKEKDAKEGGKPAADSAPAKKAAEA
jgi:putative FmdB family regulatory protein